MFFSSNIFLFFFLPLTLLLYYLCPRRFRNALLLAVSLLFYAWGEPVYLSLMVFTILLNYLSGRLLGKPEQRPERRKSVLVLALVLNLSLLGFFKYAGFLARTLNALLPAALGLPVPEIPLPIGISFYIFQSMSYTIDVYRGQVPPQRNLLRFGTYVSLFPQLIAGPIVRYRDVAQQLESRRENLPQAAAGVQLFILGLAKKILLANRMGELWETLKGSGGTLAAWVCMFAYTLQIYFDFSGYSDMAIGLGRMFGFEFLPNFDYPYISRSVTEFWRRWHISLGTWFREYVYIPLGGNRRGKARWLLNLFIVWGLTGLWHGASWNFVLWGLFYALLLSAEKLFLLKGLERLPGAVRCLLVFVTVSLGWVLFSFPDMGELGAFLLRLVSAKGETAVSLNRILAYLPLMGVSLLAATPLPKTLYHRLDGKRVQAPLLLLWLTVLMLLCVAALASQSYNPFIYFRF